MATFKMYFDKNSGQYIAYEDHKEIARAGTLDEMTQKIRSLFENPQQLLAPLPSADSSSDSRALLSKKAK